MRKGRTCLDLDPALFFDPDEIRGKYGTLGGVNPLQL
jgi:hypothetical protein